MTIVIYDHHIFKVQTKGDIIWQLIYPDYGRKKFSATWHRCHAASNANNSVFFCFARFLSSHSCQKIPYAKGIL